MEGVVGISPPHSGSTQAQEGAQTFEKLCEVVKILQKSLEPLKNVSGNIHRMNMLITLCNKRLDALDLNMRGNINNLPDMNKNYLKIIETKDDNS